MAYRDHQLPSVKIQTQSHASKAVGEKLFLHVIYQISPKPYYCFIDVTPDFRELLKFNSQNQIGQFTQMDDKIEVDTLLS